MQSEIYRLILVVGALAIASYLSKFLRHPSNKKNRYKNFFWLFVSFAAHQASLSFTFLFFNSHRLAAIIGYEIAVVFYFIVLYFAIKVIEVFHPQYEKTFSSINIFIVGLATISLISYAFYPVLPVVHGNFVQWGSSELSGLICGLSGFAVGIIWAITFLNGWSKNFSSREKAKIIFLTLAGLFLGLSCIPFFMGTSITYFIVDYIATFLGIACAIAAVFMPGKEKNA